MRYAPGMGAGKRPLAGNVLSMREAREGLSRIIDEFENDPGAEPVTIGGHRRAQAVLMPVARYNDLLTLIGIASVTSALDEVLNRMGPPPREAGPEGL